MNNVETWLKGEFSATEFLKSKKYQILEKNFNCALGEIDVIAKQKNTIVFVEVKSRSNTRFGLPREAITKNKILHIKKTALLYLKMNKLLNSAVRFDCIEVLYNKITHIENAF